MRKVLPVQLQLGEIDIASIQLDLTSRDDIPQLLQGLQFLHANEAIRSQIFSILEELTPNNISCITGRPGMHWWKILVMGTLRLNLNWDYDRLHEMVNNHKTIREMLGHGVRDEDDQYKLQTLKDNVGLFTPVILDKLNQIVVAAGHHFLKKKDVEIKGRCDSFVTETHVHFPTDISLLFDAVRKVVLLTASLSDTLGFSLCRQSQHNLKQLKKRYRVAQKIKHSTSKDKEKIALREKAVIVAYTNYLHYAEALIQKSTMALEVFGLQEGKKVIEQEHVIEHYMAHAKRQISQTRTRVIDGIKIPHAEKVFSIFQEHTEWISKGKAGVPVELGLRVCIMEDQYGFILHHNVMKKETDDQVAVRMVEETQARFTHFNGCSFDKGFHSPANQIELQKRLKHPVLPKKGRRNKEELKRERSEEFKADKRQHSAVESAINALEVHGLDKCPDHGIEGFERYVGLAVLSRNIQKLGAEIRKQEQLKNKRKQKRLHLVM
jgi:IS5 family transposase